MAGGLIPQSFVQDLLGRVDIVEVIGARLELKRAGREYKACSPFTNEKTPSFHVSPAKQMFFDFSSGKNGNAIGFLMEHDRLSFVEAVEELAGTLGIEVPREGGQFQRLVLDGPLDALAAGQRFFTEQLRQHAAAVDYLKRRGVSGETAKTFGIGFAPDSWDALSKFFDDPRHALDAGLIKRKEGADRVYDVFRNRIMFPIRDNRGRTIAFGGRTLGDDPAKYLNSPETALFHKGRNLFGLYEAKQARKSAPPYLLVVEGYMDVVMLAEHGVTDAVATLGTATTAEHLSLLFKTCNRVVFCFDGDRAGRSAAWRAFEQALPTVDDRREVQFMFLPDGHDPDSLVQEIGADAFRERVEQALSLSTYLIQELEKQASLRSLDGRAKFAGLASKHVQKMLDSPLRTLLVEELSRLTRLPAEGFLSGASVMDQTLTTQRQRRPVDPGAVRPVKRALKILLEMPALALEVDQLDQLLESDAPGVSFLVDAIDFFHENEGASVAQLISSFGEDNRKVTAIKRVLDTDTDDPSLGPGLGERMSEAHLRTEFTDSIRKLCNLRLVRRLEFLQTESTLRDMSPQEIAEMGDLIRQLSKAKLG